MPRRTSVRPQNEDGPHRGDEARRSWAVKWKRWAVGQLPADTPVSVKVQLRAEVDRALVRYRPDDDDAEIRDVVSSVVEETLGRLETMAAKQRHKVSKKAVITLAPVFLRAALLKHDRRLVAMMLRKPESSLTALTSRVQRYLKRQLKGDEDHEEVQREVDAWVVRRLAEQPPASGKGSRIALGAAGAVAVAAGVVAYQRPAVKAAVGRGLTRAQQLLDQLKPPSPPAPPPAQGPSNGIPNR